MSGPKRDFDFAERGRGSKGPASMLPERGNFEVSMTPLVGRRREVFEVKDLLGRARLVTLIGVGGVGKTRLAHAVAVKSRAAFRDGVWLVALADLRNGALIADVVASTLGVGTQNARTSSEAVAQFLRTRRSLIVFDQCEHVVQDVANLVTSLLRQCDGLRILATSREVVGMAGEAVLRVPPLPVHSADVDSQPPGDAVRLFVDRARDVLPGYAITTENSAQVARICTTVDGLPLAIELAARRLRSMSLEQLEQRLSDRFSLLTGGPRDVPEHQQTMRAVLDWSFALCESAERQVWVSVSVFSGSFELDAAEDLLSQHFSPGEVLDLLSSLVDKSILIREEVDRSVRFRMLDTVSEYGRDQLKLAGEATEWYRKHCNWYSYLVRRVDAEWLGKNQRHHLNRLTRELPNLRQALSFSLSGGDDPETSLKLSNGLFRFWLACGLVVEGRSWTERVLGDADAAGRGESDWAEALFASSFWAGVQRDTDSARIAVERLQALDAHGPHPLVHAHRLLAEGMQALFSGDAACARPVLEVALSIFEAEGVERSQVEASLALAWANLMLADYDGALAQYRQVLRRTEPSGEEMYRSHAYWGIGDSLWRLKKLEESERALLQGVRLAVGRQDAFVTALCLEVLAWIADAQADASRAAVLVTTADAALRRAGATQFAFPAMVYPHQACVRNVRRRLGASQLEAIQAEVSSMNLDEAVASVLGESEQEAVADRVQLPNLTQRECEVAELVAEGLSDKAIAARLVISVRTVGGHVQHILAKLDFRSRASIAGWVAARDRSQG